MRLIGSSLRPRCILQSSGQPVAGTNVTDSLRFLVIMNDIVLVCCKQIADSRAQVLSLREFFQ